MAKNWTINQLKKHASPDVVVPKANNRTARARSVKRQEKESALVPMEKRGYCFTLPYPPSSNRYWRFYRGVVVRSSDAVQYKKAVASALRYAGVDLLNGDISVAMIVYRPRQQGDLDNRIKILLDAMNGIVYVDDKQIAVIHAERREDKQSPRVEIMVEEI